MIIEVTQEDVDNGKPGFPACCPVSQAFRRVGASAWVLPQHDGLKVGVTWYHRGRYHYRRFVASPEASRAVMRYDRGFEALRPMLIEFEEAESTIGLAGVG